MDEIPTTNQQPAKPVSTQQPASPARTQQPPRDESMIYVGKKELMSYVLAVVTQFNNKQPQVHLKARGKLIARAVDIAEIVRNRFLPDLKVKNIEISTEELKSMDGRMSNVSSIQITLAK